MSNRDIQLSTRGEHFCDDGQCSFFIDGGMQDARYSLSSTEQGPGERGDVPTSTLQAVYLLQILSASASDLGRPSALRFKPFKQ